MKYNVFTLTSKNIKIYTIFKIITGVWAYKLSKIAIYYNY